MMQDFREALQAEMETDSALYKAIRAAYIQEQADSNGNTLQQHCSGVMAAIKAVYQLGYGQGFTAGADYAEQEILGD